MIRNNPLVSVVIPVYNVEKTIIYTIDSILRQTYRDIEIVIVNDGSTDNTANILNKYCGNTNVKIFYQENGGISRALNFGIKNSSGDLIARIDGDDIAELDRIDLQVKEFQLNARLVLLGSSVTYINESGNSIGRNFCFTNPALIKKHISEHNFFWHPTVMFTREAFEKVGKYEEQLAGLFEDYFLFSKLSEIGECKNLSKPLTQYRISADQITSGAICNDFKIQMHKIIENGRFNNRQIQHLKDLKLKSKYNKVESTCLRLNLVEKNPLYKIYLKLLKLGFSKSISNNTIVYIKNMIGIFRLYDFKHSKIKRLWQ